MKILEMSPISHKTTIQYPNIQCQQVWGDKISKANNLYPQLELLTVAHGVRESMICHNVNPGELHVLYMKLAKLGLYAVPIVKEAISGNMHTSGGRVNSGPYNYRVAVSSSLATAEALAQAHADADDIAIGKLLGFPEDSTKFFDNIWKKGYIDPMWQQAENTDTEYVKFNRVKTEKVIEENVIRIKVPEEFSITSSVFRYIGVRVLSHIPESMSDTESLSIAKDWVRLAEDLKLEGLQETLDILKLPFSWDCLKGIAIISTPVFKFSSVSVACYPRYIIEGMSDFYPEEAPNGIYFPWKMKNKIDEVKK